MKLLNGNEFIELAGASRNEKKQAIHLASSRYPWFRDAVYLRKMMGVLIISITVSLLILNVLPSDIWLMPVVFVSTFISGFYPRFLSKNSTKQTD